MNEGSANEILQNPAQQFIAFCNDRSSKSKHTSITAGIEYLNRYLTPDYPGDVRAAARKLRDHIAQYGRGTLVGVVLHNLYLSASFNPDKTPNSEELQNDYVETNEAVHREALNLGGIIIKKTGDGELESISPPEETGNKLLDEATDLLYRVQDASYYVFFPEESQDV
jgi:hypothetical protein